MTPEEFKNYCKEDQELIFLEMCELYNIIANYPITVNELKIFTKWHQYIARWGNDLKDFLTGVYPCQALENLNESNDADEISKIRKLSDEALNFVAYWNKTVHKHY